MFRRGTAVPRLIKPAVFLFDFTAAALCLYFPMCPI
nr:MAG TPA: hypothetical protein [Caudoviricetes sp.]